MSRKRRSSGSHRDGTRFLALPHVVLDSAAFLKLSSPAVRLLIDIARQHSGANNGSLVACMRYLATRGWTSNATIIRARRELEAAGFLIQTRMGARPNRAALFALAWAALDWLPTMEIGATYYERELRGLYCKNDPLPPILKTRALHRQPVQ